MNGILMVGRNVRRFRQERQLSLGDLAKSAGLAKQTLANLENGTGNPTIETLLAVSEALGLGVTWLLAEWGTPVYVQRAAEAQWDEQAGCRIRTLDRTFGSGQVNTFVFELSGPDGDGEALPALPGGALHHVYVIDGVVTAGPSSQEVTLRKGDFIRFPGDVPHLFRATTPAAALHVVTTVPQAQQFSA
jgi:transcriptional regulator with XRE-family HTH domain